MQIIMLKVRGGNSVKNGAAVLWKGKAILIETINESFQFNWRLTVAELLESSQWEELLSWYNSEGKFKLDYVKSVSFDKGDIVKLYDKPNVVWGVGANYWKKAEQMKVTPPDGEPICFMKPPTSLIGHGENIVIPHISEDVTAEAEIGIVIGQQCKDVSIEEAWDVVAGFTPTLDMTAQDIHARNPRFLGRSKVCDTFCSFGPLLISKDEVEDWSKLSIETILNGEVIHQAVVADMIYSIPYIVHYFSTMMTLMPGDMIMTGTPGSVKIKSRDVVESRIHGFMELENGVRNTK